MPSAPTLAELFHNVRVKCRDRKRKKRSKNNEETKGK
jgi:hypothetical protein